MRANMQENKRYSQNTGLRDGEKQWFLTILGVVRFVNFDDQWEGKNHQNQGDTDGSDGSKWP